MRRQAIRKTNFTLLKSMEIPPKYFNILLLKYRTEFFIKLLVVHTKVGFVFYETSQNTSRKTRKFPQIKWIILSYSLLLLLLLLLLLYYIGDFTLLPFFLSFIPFRCNTSYASQLYSIIQSPSLIIGSFLVMSLKIHYLQKLSQHAPCLLYWPQKLLCIVYKVVLGIELLPRRVIPKVFKRAYIKCTSTSLLEKIRELIIHVDYVLTEHITNLAQSFDSKIPGAENLLVRQLGRYLFYPRDE